MNKLQHYRLNKAGRDFFVGDIHGCFKLLQYKLDEVNFNPKTDRLFSVGDLVDRGEDSDEVIDWLNKPWFHAVRGNHEDMCISYFQSPLDARNSAYLMNGGQWFIVLPEDRQEKIVNYLIDLPYQITVETALGTVGVIHAEVARDDWSYATDNMTDYQVQRMALWSRDKVNGLRGNKNTTVAGVDYVVVGHTPHAKPRLLGNVFYIDTGAVFSNGSLTVKTIDELIKEVVV